MWSLQYESKASKHGLKASAFCESKTSIATTRGRKAHLTLGEHHIFCNIRIVFRFFLLYNEVYVQRAAGIFQFLLPATAISGRCSGFIARYSEQRAFFNFYCPPVYIRSLLARIIGQKKKRENRACVTNKLQDKKCLTRYLRRYIDALYEEKHCSRSWTKTSTAQNLGCRKARVGRKERLSCACFRLRTAICASVRNGLSCAFLRTGRGYVNICQFWDNLFFFLPFVSPAGPPLRITPRGWPQLFSFSTISDVRLLLVLLTGNRYCWSPRFSASLLFFSQPLHDGCDRTADRGPVFLRL